jgi:diaminopimelate decarboxylase
MPTAESNAAKSQLSSEVLKQMPYVERMKEMYQGFRFWEYVDYDKEGDLWINGIRVLDIAGNIANETNVKHTGLPAEVVDPAIEIYWARQFIKWGEETAKKVGYTGKLTHLYATKAAPAAEIVVGAMKAGWELETSADQDIYNILWLNENGLLPKGCNVICNGFKLDPKVVEDWTVRKVTQIIPVNGDVQDTIFERHETYAEQIINAANAGIHVVPVFDDRQEIPFFKNSGVPLEVGVRFKAYDGVKQHADYKHLVSRHGMDEAGVYAAAQEISESENLTLTTFHAMIGAAGSFPVADHVGALMAAADTFFKLQKTHRKLTKFNIGGGIPSPGVKIYDHKEFLKELFTQMKQKARENHARMPEIEFECGSMVASEAAYAMMGVDELKINNIELDGTQIPWDIVNYSLLNGLIDMTLTGERYILLAANNGNEKVGVFRIGGETCDHDDIMRSDKNPLENLNSENILLLPDVSENYNPESRKEPLVLVVLSIQAYEEMLTGVDAVNHCQLAKPINVIVVRDVNGKVSSLNIEHFKGPRAAMKALGYHEEFLPVLKSIAEGR